MSAVQKARSHALTIACKACGADLAAIAAATATGPGQFAHDRTVIDPCAGCIKVAVDARTEVAEAKAVEARRDAARAYQAEQRAHDQLVYFRRLAQRLVKLVRDAVDAP
jgi:hypothetical protein